MSTSRRSRRWRLVISMHLLPGAWCLTCRHCSIGSGPIQLQDLSIRSTSHRNMIRRFPLSTSRIPTAILSTKSDPGSGGFPAAAGAAHLSDDFSGRVAAVSGRALAGAVGGDLRRPDDWHGHHDGVRASAVRCFVWAAAGGEEGNATTTHPGGGSRLSLPFQR